MDDFELLQAYASDRREDAFSTLTGRYLNLVYSAAARQTGNAQSAEDVTQAVFLTLARKAGALSRDTVLSGWLLRTTRFAAANARRLEQRRQHYEQQAMQSYVCPSEGEATWQRIAPQLDEALDRLAEKDRDAIALRFLEHKSLKEVAEKLGVSEDGAQKRVTRAIEKLRAFFMRQGKGVSAVALTGVLAANAVQAAPARLTAAIVAAVAGKGVATGSIVATLAGATLSALVRARLQLFAVRAGSVAVLLGLATFTAFRANKSGAASSLASADSPTVVPAAEAAAGSPPPPAPVAFAAAAALPQPEQRELLLRVVDAQSGVPVTNALLTLVSITAFPQRSTHTFVTDAEGASRVAYSMEPVKSWSHRIEIFRDGYVPKFVSWSESQLDRMDDIPDEYTAKVDPAVRIGGKVVDETNTPVPGMRVVFSVSGPIASRSRERLTMMGGYHTEVTDEHGLWSCTHVPARFGMIDYKLTHPNFQDKSFASDSPDSPAYTSIDRLAEADLLAGRALMRVQRGLVIAGTVATEDGRPVAGAKVTQGFAFSSEDRRVFTDAGGLFRFGNGRPRQLSLTIQAEGLAPVVTTLVVNASVENLNVTLPTGQKLRGQVVDEAGLPISGATVEAVSPSADSRTLFEWRAKTDADGRFRWDAAPASQEYAVYASGYETQSRAILKAGADEQVIPLKKKTGATAVRILGQVVDAETKASLPKARAQIWETTKESGGSTSSFTTRPEDADPEGKFRFKTSSGTISYVLEIQADGYWPERLTNQASGPSNVQLNVELKKAPLHAGVVLTPLGEPAAGATLVVLGHQEWAQMNQPGKLQIGQHSSSASTTSDGLGQFRLPPKHAPEVVVVAHAQGFAEIPFSQVTSNAVIALQPWGRIEGTAQVGGKAIVGETLRLGVMPWRAYRSPRVSMFFGAATDGAGRFVFESIPSGDWKVEREINPRPDGKMRIHIPAFSHGVPVVVRSGETARVTLGGGGRAVAGRAATPGVQVPIAWTENSVALILKAGTSGAPKPPLRTTFSSDADFQAAQKQYYQQSEAYWLSDAGRAAQQLQREYRAMFAADGSFRIEDVPPGDYALKVSLTEPPKASDGNRFNFTPVASLEMDVTIPEAGGASDLHALDLGVLSLTAVPNP